MTSSTNWMKGLEAKMNGRCPSRKTLEGLQMTGFNGTYQVSPWSAWSLLLPQWKVMPGPIGELENVWWTLRQYKHSIQAFFVSLRIQAMKLMCGNCRYSKHNKKHTTTKTSQWAEISEQQCHMQDDKRQHHSPLPFPISSTSCSLFISSANSILFMPDVVYQLVLLNFNF